jgi:hypothetical protein
MSRATSRGCINVCPTWFAEMAKHQNARWKRAYPRGVSTQETSSFSDRPFEAGLDSLAIQATFSLPNSGGFEYILKSAFADGQLLLMCAFT